MSPMRIIKGKAPARLPLGMRFNNPGNIFHVDRNGDGKPDAPDWNGAAVAQPHKEVVAFVDVRWGLRAMVKLPVNYQKLHGIETIDALVGRYAPAADKRNPTKAYAEFVAKAVGVTSWARLDFTSSGILLRLIPAMVRFEQGYQPFQAWEYVRAIEDAGVGVDL